MSTQHTKVLASRGVRSPDGDDGRGKAPRRDRESLRKMSPNCPEGFPNPGSPTEHVTKGITSAVKAVWSPQQKARNRQEGWTILWTSLSGGPGWSAAERVSRLIGVGIVIQEPAGRGSPSVPYR